MIDYYQVLGVPPDASTEAIRAAYRRLANIHHPDRGGTHERMLRLNEAWQILRNPTERATYDAARSAAPPPGALARIEVVVREAAARAASYPRRWGEFEAWLDRLQEDFARTEYGSTGTRPGEPLSYPTTTTLSGNVFIGAGGVAGLLVSLVIVSGYWEGVAGHRHIPFAFKVGLIFGPILLGIWAGTWAGRLLHQGIRDTVAGSPPSRPASPPGQGGPADKLVVRCPTCGQLARLPRLASALTVTCPRCNTKFDQPPAA